MISPVRFLSLAFFLTLWISTGCQQRESPRVYDEIASQGLNKPASMPMMNASPVDIDIQWEAPSHWMLKDTGSGMRAGSYGIPDSAFFGMGELNPEAVDVSITHFAGDAGGLGPNTQRWMGQVGIHLDSAALKGFLARAKKFRTQTGDEGVIIDLTEMLSGDLTQSQTIYGAIIPWKGATVFVKAMGERSRVIMAREDIFAFCESLRLKEGEN